MLNLRATTEPFESIILVSENLISLPSICSGRNIKKAFATLHMDYGVRSRLNEFDQVHRLAVKWWIIHWIIGKSYSVLAFALKKKKCSEKMLWFFCCQQTKTDHMQFGLGTPNEFGSFQTHFSCGFNKVNELQSNILLNMYDYSWLHALSRISQLLNISTEQTEWKKIMSIRALCGSN